MRTALPPDSLAAGIRTALRPLDPNLPVTEFQTLQGLVDKVVSPRRFLVMLLSGFAVFALLLASLGIYALISYSVNERTKEIGIRMALGANSGVVLRGVLATTLRLALAGVALGTLASFALSKWLESLLFGTTPTNPAVFSGVALLLCAVAWLLPTFRRDEPHASSPCRPCEPNEIRVRPIESWCETSCFVSGHAL